MKYILEEPQGRQIKYILNEDDTKVESDASKRLGAAGLTTIDGYEDFKLKIKRLLNYKDFMDAVKSPVADANVEKIRTALLGIVTDTDAKVKSIYKFFDDALEIYDNRFEYRAIGLDITNPIFIKFYEDCAQLAQGLNKTLPDANILKNKNRHASSQTLLVQFADFIDYYEKVDLTDLQKNLVTVQQFITLSKSTAYEKSWGEDIKAATDGERDLLGKEIQTADPAKAAALYDAYLKSIWPDDIVAIIKSNLGDAFAADLKKYGYTADKNPFLAYVIRVLQVKKQTITSNAYQAVRNALENGVITKKDIQGNTFKSEVLYSRDFCAGNHTRSELINYLKICDAVLKIDLKKANKNNIYLTRYNQNNIKQLYTDILFTGRTASNFSNPGNNTTENNLRNLSDIAEMLAEFNETATVISTNNTSEKQTASISHVKRLLGDSKLNIQKFILYFVSTHSPNQPAVLQNLSKLSIPTNTPLTGNDIIQYNNILNSYRITEKDISALAKEIKK